MAERPVPDQNPVEHPTRYPIYIPTKGRHDHTSALTARFLMRDGVPFRVVVESQEAEQYAKLVGEDRVLELPFSNLGKGSIPARNWIIEHSIAEGAERHWQLDDNIRDVRWMREGDRIPCNAALGLGACEDFTDRYENVLVSGLNYQMFVTPSTPTPYFHNVHVYSCTLADNSMPYRWRGRYNEDTDLCLQVLAGGDCTILINAFCADKLPTMTMGGGNTDELYAADGRLRMARELERRWPGVVKVDRRYGRPQHVVDWKKFDTPLQRKPDYDRIVAEQTARARRVKMRAGDVKAGRLRAKVERWAAE
jgi:hypothetical protein